MDDVKLLIIEDDPDIGKMIVEILDAVKDSIRKPCKGKAALRGDKFQTS